MRQPYTLTRSLEVGVPCVKNGLKCLQMANKKNVTQIQSYHPNFYNPTRCLEHKNQGFVRQNFGHTKRAWIPE